MKSTTLLERQHRNVQQLCEAVERGSPSIRESLLPQLANDLFAHFRIEEQLFFPAVRAALGECEPHSPPPDAHGLLRTYLEHILDTPPADEEFAVRIAELRSALEAHIEEEEELLFPTIEAALSPSENRALAERMMALHHASVEDGYERGLVTRHRVIERVRAQAPAHRSR